MCHPPPIVDVDPKNLVVPSYCGLKNMRPSLTTTCLHFVSRLRPWRFRFVKHAYPKLYYVWMGRLENEVVKDEQSNDFRHVHIQWWVPMKKGARNDRELY